jgi:hypothetical protein
MLMESEHNMAREDKEGSAREIEFTAFVSCLFGESNLRVRESEGRRFSLLANGTVS